MSHWYFISTGVVFLVFCHGPLELQFAKMELPGWKETMNLVSTLHTPVLRRVDPPSVRPGPSSAAAFRSAALALAT